MSAKPPHLVYISHINVLDQALGENPEESCGYHTFKNVIITMLEAQGKIIPQQASAMRVGKPLFSVIYKSTNPTSHENGNDLQIPAFFELLKKAKAGEFDFTVSENPSISIPTSLLMQMNLDPHPNGNLSVISVLRGEEAPAPGLGGTEEDLCAAAALARLAKNKGSTHHMFAVATNDSKRNQSVGLDYMEMKTKLLNSSLLRIQKIFLTLWSG